VEEGKLSMKLLLAILAAVGFVAMPSMGNAQSGVAPADKTAIVSSLEGIIKQAETGSIKDVDPVIAALKGVVEKGKAVVAAVAARDAANRKLLEFVGASVDKMYGEDLESIETNWHKGGAAKTAGPGADFEKVDERSPASAAMTSVIHPVTAILALQAYKKEPQKAHLDQVAKELKEQIERMASL